MNVMGPWELGAGTDGTADVDGKHVEKKYNDK